MGLDPISIALAAVSAVSTGASIYKGQQADKQNRKAADLMRRQEQLKSLQERRNYIRSARASAAKAAQAAANQGASNTSAAQGGLGSIISQAGAGLSFLDQYNTLSTQIGNVSTKANRAASQAQMYGGLSQLAMQGAGYFANKGGKPATTATGATQGPPVS